MAESATASPETSKNTESVKNDLPPQTQLEQLQAYQDQIIAIGSAFVKQDEWTSSPEKIRAIKSLIDSLRKVALKIEKHAAIPAPKTGARSKPSTT